MKHLIIAFCLLSLGCSHSKRIDSPSNTGALGWTDHDYLFESFSTPGEFVFTKPPFEKNINLLPDTVYFEINSFYKPYVLSLLSDSNADFASEEEVAFSLGAAVRNAIVADKIIHGFKGEVFFVPVILFRRKTHPEYYVYETPDNVIMVFSVAPEEESGDVKLDYSLLMIQIESISGVVEYIIPPNMILKQ